MPAGPESHKRPMRGVFISDKLLVSSTLNGRCVRLPILRGISYERLGCNIQLWHLVLSAAEARRRALTDIRKPTLTAGSRDLQVKET